MERGLRTLRETGLTEPEKLSVVRLLSGFLCNEATLVADIGAGSGASGGTAPQIMPRWGRLLARLTDRERFPALHAALASEAFDQDDDPDDEFVFGLERILDGVAALVRTRSRRVSGPMRDPRTGILRHVIARRWRGWASAPADADAYVSHFERAVRPRLAATDGFIDATLERVEGDDRRTEIVVVTRWASMEAIRAFAGDDVDDAVVAPEARAVLDDFETRVRHIELRDDDAFEHLELIDVATEAAAHEPWFNETLATVNDAVVRLGVIEGEFHWHKHDDQDEFFLVLDGELQIDLADGRTVTLGPHHAFTVPRAVVHRTRAAHRTAILMVEAAGVVPTGD